MLPEHSHIKAVMSDHVSACAQLANVSQVLQPHQAYFDCRVSFYAKLRFVSRHDTESLFIAEIEQFLRVINADAEVLRLAVCKLYPARYGCSEDIMTASLSSQAQQVLAVDISELDTKLVTGKEGSKLFGLVYKNTSGMS